MVQNIMILPTPPRGKTLIAARLCNFLTGDSHPLHDHETWINNEFRDKVDASPDLSINIQAFASKRGSESFNQTLSERRLAAVKASITAAIGVAKAKFTDGSKALGESVSAGGENNDDGYWRAVEVYAFGSRPPAGTILPIIGSPPDPDQWFVSNLSLTSGSFVDGFGVGGFWGPITFQQGGEDGPEYTYRMRLAGVAAGESAGFPLDEEEFKFTKQILDNQRIAKILKYAADNGGLSFGSAPSFTAGICFPNPLKVSRLQPSDFSGECVAIFYSGNLYFVGNGVYLLFFGLPLGFWHQWSTIEAIRNNMIGLYIASQCNGVAYISTPLGVGLSGSVGIAANAMYGYIT